MPIRLLRALALSLAVFFGWSSAASAQATTSTTYDFSFTATGFTGNGQITVIDSTKAVTAALLHINGFDYYLNTTIGFGGSAFGSMPTLNSVSAPSISNSIFVSSPTAQRLVVAQQNAAAGRSIEFFNVLNGVDRISSFESGSLVNGNISYVSESFTAAVPAPLPGSGLISWIIGAIALAAVVVVRQLRGRREPQSLLA